MKGCLCVELFPLSFCTFSECVLPFVALIGSYFPYRSGHYIFRFLFLLQQCLGPCLFLPSSSVISIFALCALDCWQSTGTVKVHWIKTNIGVTTCFHVNFHYDFHSYTAHNQDSLRSQIDEQKRRLLIGSISLNMICSIDPYW